MPISFGHQLELLLAPPQVETTEDEKADSGQKLDAHAMRIGSALGILLNDTVDVVLNENRSTMISYKLRGGRLVVRLHKMFRHATDDELGDLAGFIAGSSKKCSAAMDRFIEAHRDEVASSARRSRRAARRSAGEHYDLRDVLTRVGGRYFGGLNGVEICWGRARSRARKRNARTRSRALATYCYDDRTIRVNPVLDSSRVPRYVIEWVIYHEMLHHVLPIEVSGGKRRYHTHRFKVLEKAFAKYEKAIAWEEANLDWLLR